MFISRAAVLLCLSVGSINAFAPPRPVFRGIAATFLQNSADVSSPVETSKDEANDAPVVDTPLDTSASEEVSKEAPKEAINAENNAVSVEITPKAVSNEEKDVEIASVKKQDTEVTSAEVQETLEASVEEQDAQDTSEEEPETEVPSAEKTMVEEKEPETPKLKGEGVIYYKRPVIVKSVEEKKEIQKKVKEETTTPIIISEDIKKKGEGVVYYKRKQLEEKDIYLGKVRTKADRDRVNAARRERQGKFTLKKNEEKRILVKNLDRTKPKKKPAKKVVMTREEKQAKKKALFEAKKERQGKFVLKKNEAKVIAVKNRVASKSKVATKKKKVQAKKKIEAKKKVEPKKKSSTATTASTEKPRKISYQDLLDAREQEPEIAGLQVTATKEAEVKAGLFSGLKEKVLVPPLFGAKKGKK